MSPLVFLVQKFGYIHVHEARTRCKARAGGDLNTATGKVYFARLDAGPVPRRFPVEAVDEVLDGDSSHRARLKRKQAASAAGRRPSSFHYNVVNVARSAGR